MTPVAGACAAADMGLDMIEVSARRRHRTRQRVGAAGVVGMVCTTTTFDGLLAVGSTAVHAPFRHLRRPGASNPSGDSLGPRGGRRHRAEDAPLLVGVAWSLRSRPIDT
jgi:hypothetical protein